MEYLRVGDYALYKSLADVFVCRVVSMEIECDTIPTYGIEYLDIPNKEEENVARCYLIKLHRPSYPEDTVPHNKDIILYDLYKGKVAWIDQSFYDPTIRYINGTIRNFTRWEFEHRYLEIPTVYLAARIVHISEGMFVDIMNKFKNEFSLAIKTVDASEYCIDYDYTSCYLKRNANSIIPGDYVVYNSYTGIYICLVHDKYRGWGDTSSKEAVYGLEFLGVGVSEKATEVREDKLFKLHYATFSDILCNKYTMLYDIVLNKIAWTEETRVDMAKIRAIDGTIHYITDQELKNRYLLIPTIFVASRIAGMNESELRAIVNRHKVEKTSAANDCVDAMSYLNRYNLVYNSISDVTVGDYVIVHGTSTEFDGKIGIVRSMSDYLSIVYVEVNGGQSTSCNIKYVTKIEPISKVAKNIYPGSYLYIARNMDCIDNAGLYRVEDYDPVKMIYSIYSLKTRASCKMTREFIVYSKYMYYIPATDYLTYISPYIKNDERSIKDMYNKMFVENVALCGRGNAKSLTYLQSCLLNSPMFGNLKIKDVKFSGPCTIVFFTDGTKTMVRCQNGEVNDPEKGLAMAIVKKFLGTNPSGSNFYDVFKKFLPKEDEPASNKEEKKTEKKPKPVIKARPQKPTNPKLGFIDEFVVAVERRPTYFPADFIKFCKDHHLYFYIEVDGQYMKCDPEKTNWQTVAGYCKRGVLAGIKKHKTSDGKAGKGYWAVDVNYVIFSRMTPPATHNEPCEGNEDA